ncbi:hypothetical protein [uncultured Gammaproteobacteria bacterium]|nr:hypothetical protein [uncultured Gammaproteobacteria bacterium]CAC9592658.1 hypothetical protein [uncultured Gammaproteobacteria bacterium]CAC9963313.1 hypothetical protein [uncultured Gammaproteobacteria bacterium]
MLRASAHYLPPHRWLRKLFYTRREGFVNLPPHRWLRNI